MNAKSLIAAWIFVASGCAILESPPSEPETSPVTAPVTEPENLSAVAEAPKPQPPPARSLTADDVRRIQMRLREAGFDPGPADGVAGARTKSAFNRYLSGCAKTKTLLDDFDEAGVPGKGALSRQESQAVQSQLRRAGFDPGSTDGIFGARTRKTIVQLKANCSTFNELAVLLNNQTLPPLERKREPLTVASSTSTKARPLTASASGESANQTAAPRGKEEIRILQLRLRDAGFDPGPFDGVMGPKTIAALQQYEASERVKKTKASVKTIDSRSRY